MKISNNKQGRIAKIVGTTISVPVMIITALIVFAIGWLSFCELNKAYWDDRVKALCEKDGGVRVYEKVHINYELYKKLGGNEYGLPIYSRNDANPAPFFTEATTTTLNEKNPWVRRTETRYFQLDGNKMIAADVYYGRVGGDFPSWAHHSSYGCKIPKGEMTKQFILVEGQ